MGLMPTGKVVVSREFLRAALFGAMQVELDEIVLNGARVEIAVHGLDVPETDLELKPVKEVTENRWLAPRDPRNI